MGSQSQLFVLLIGASFLFHSIVFVVHCQGESECYDGNINPYTLNFHTDVNDLTIIEGRLEICTNGVYESICDIGWDGVDAQAACRYWFSGISHDSEALTGLGFPDRQYLLQTYNCSEGDHGLDSCRYSPSIDPQCYNGSHVAGIRCTQFCDEGDIRLQNTTATFNTGLSTYMGRVEVCVNRSFYTVCDAGWDNRDAQVACNRRFGSSFIGEVYPSIPLPPRSRYLAQDLMCNGTESSISQCRYNPPGPECYVGNHSAAVACREVCAEGDVNVDSLTFSTPNGLSAISAVIQVCVNQQYGYVCADNWDDKEADVACRSFRSWYQSPYYENTASTTSVNSTIIHPDLPIYRYAMCNGTESDLSMCQLPRLVSGSTCSSIGTMNCTEIILQCSRFSEGDFILADQTADFSPDGSITVAGRIEVCANSSYSSLCDYYWNPVDAQVFCRNYFTFTYGVPSSANITSQAIAGSQYGYSRAGIAPYDVTCNGSESRLEDCDLLTASSSSMCDDPTTSAAGVVCSYYATSTLPPMIVTPTEGPTVPPTPTGIPTCADFELQLGNEVYSVVEDLTTHTSAFSVSGNVEICVAGTFYSVCDEGWGQEEARVACNALNYPSRNYRATPLSGLTSNLPIIAENVMCFGNETSTLQCNFTAPPVSPRCYDSSNAAGVQCTQVRTPCETEGLISIVNPEYEGYLNIFTGGQVNLTGRVGVCKDKFYDLVCDVNWDANDADVLCRSILPRSSAIPVYGLNAGRDTVVLEDVQCIGNESNIANCSTSPIGQVSNPFCQEPNRTAGVICITAEDYCAEGSVRLVDGPTFFEGRVEVCRNSQWLSVCDVGANTTHAITACDSRFHYGGNATAVYGSAYSAGTGPQLGICIIDTGYSSDIQFIPIENCTSNPDLQRLCSHDRDAGVRCQPGLLDLSITATEVPSLGSTTFALQCFGIEFPWEARLDSQGWYKFGTLLPPDDLISTNVIQDGYNPSAFNVSYIFRSQVTFDRPLTINDRGEYSCNVSILLTYPDDSTYLLTNSTSYILNISGTVPSPLVAISTNGTQYVGTRFEANCFVELLSSELAPYVTVDYLDGSFVNLSSRLEENPEERIQLLPTRQYNETHLVRTIIVDPLSSEDQGTYHCVANISAPYLSMSASVLSVLLQVFSNDSGVQIIDVFLPFGPDHGDSTVPARDDGSSEEIVLETGVVIYGSSYNRLYVNTNGVLSFEELYTSPSAYGSNFSDVFSPPIIAPFWDDIDVTEGGTIYHRQDSDPAVVEQVQQEIASHYPEAESFRPSLVFVATWDRVEPYDVVARGLVNTFQVVVVSDGIWTFVTFSYGNIQWGGSNTLIGISAGDMINFITHPASLSSSVLSLDNTTTTYRVDGDTTTVPPTLPPTTMPPIECFVEGEVLSYFNDTSHGGLSRFEGTFEICIGGYYGSVCDIGWNQAATQTLCHSQFGSRYIAEPLYGLGYPGRKYTAQRFDCSSSQTSGLGSCSYNSLIDGQCYVGPHVAGVRCTERPPPPLGIQGLCTVVVWYSPEVSCEDINGYEVRLYNPQSAHLNVTRRTGANGTFYIVDEEKLVSSDETYVQVRVIHRIGEGEWSEGISLGCEKPTIPEEPPKVYFELNGKVYLNNSAVSMSEVGEGDGALYCRTDKEECCGTVPNRFGEFYYPNGVRVPIARQQQGFYRNRGEQVIRLNRREGITSPAGTYRCEIPNADDVMVKIYITLTE